MLERDLPRSLKLTPDRIDFTSNDYLGLSRSADLHKRISEVYESLPVKRNGSTGSRLLSGNSELVMQTEEKLAAIFRSEKTLLFDSGYSANLAVLSTFCHRGDSILMDERCHASIKDGARLSLANKWNFRHNDLDDLDRKLQVTTNSKWIVVESIYSMDGDLCPLEDIVALAKKYDARIILDEAHSTGVMGTGGNGYANHLDLQKDIDIRIYTFGKAMGVHGACVAMEHWQQNYMVNFSRPFIYTTAPSDHSVVSISCAVDYLREHIYLQEELKSRIDQLQSETQIHAVIVPGVEEVQRTASLLQEKGFDVRPILSPTVREGQERIRICLHTFNTPEQIGSLMSNLRTLGL
ncbi:MAG TPA: pyridoxal phosphate-dependent aminotransferase family protein [Cyclobacteriaceae bacterium]|nr:pyridoxal phosphate-dependent aminotransferase family protein [Cyclobacteriaceae bacterium]